MVPLLLFIHAMLKGRENAAEGLLTCYACCSKQGTLRYFGKPEINLSEKDFFLDCVCCEGKSRFERAIHNGL